MLDSETAKPSIDIFHGLLDREQAKAALGRNGYPMSDRTFARLIEEGLPFIALRGRKYYRIEAIRAWLLSRETSRSATPTARRRKTPRGARYAA
ncbi:hypothetical protein UAJ10_09240 [Nitrospirillum sp. BR 11164]|uniref:hypothetical protein n=1 Tax=Nitrospirillum sp. BR 11164 TaxID=3104324 RepID=UPI002AFF966A|nr:hypothetical protein [Nitrospirillum sp. BR 11164]MEA1649201.1 hypothetical protein [Nitrospirillum sp. BR 11164]